MHTCSHERVEMTTHKGKHRLSGPLPEQELFQERSPASKTFCLNWGHLVITLIAWKKRNSLPAWKRSAQSAQALSHEVLPYVPRLDSKYTHTHFNHSLSKVALLFILKFRECQYSTWFPRRCESHFCAEASLPTAATPLGKTQHGVRRPKLLDILNTLLCHRHYNRRIACMIQPGIM